MPRKPVEALKTLQMISHWKEENDGIPPTYQQIADQRGISPQAAWNHVERLHRLGFITFDQDRHFRINGTYTGPEIFSS